MNLEYQGELTAAPDTADGAKTYEELNKPADESKTPEGDTVITPMYAQVKSAGMEKDELKKEQETNEAKDESGQVSLLLYSVYRPQLDFLLHLRERK